MDATTTFIARRAPACASAVLLLLAWCPYAFALNPALDVSQYAHTSWKIRDGAFKSMISAIAQPPDGYLWLGTQLGLLRFDGLRFVPWQPPPNQTLPSNDILSLLTARDGTLWIGTAQGLASWKDGELDRYKALDGSYIGTLVEDRSGSIWMTRFVNRWTLCRISSGSPPAARSKEGETPNAICYGEDGGAGAGALGLHVDPNGTLWVGTSAGLWRWNPGPPTFYRLPSEENGIQGLADGGDGSLLMSKAGGIRRFVDGRADMKHPFPSSIQPAQSLTLLRDRDGALWAGTSTQGLVHVHEGITDVFSRIDGLSSDGVATIFEDREGSIWVATIHGLDRFRESAVVSYSVTQGLSNARVSSVLASSDGSVWVGTFDGLNRWQDGGMTVYRDRSTNSAAGGRPYVSRTVREIAGAGIAGSVQSIFEDSQRRIWVSTSRGVGYMEHDRFVPLHGVPGGLTRAILEDGRQALWIAKPADALYRLAAGRKEVDKIDWAALGHQDPASALAADPAGEGVWVGFFRGGVAHFDGSRVRASYTATDGLAEGRVSALYVDADQALWIATDAGLSRLKDGRLATLTSRNGLPCDATGWVIEDSARSLWMGMACGLVRITRPEIDTWTTSAGQHDAPDPRAVHLNVTPFDQADGVRTFLNASYYSAPAARSADGRLWFMSHNGLSVVDPSHVPVNTIPAPLHIEQVIADRQTYDVIATSGHVRLPPLTRDLQIEYTALSFAAPEKVRFRYKLEGHDRDWQEVGTRRQAFYNDLAPGPYRFRVTASNNSGVWNDTGASLDLSIAPAPYQTAWFRAASVLTILVLVGALYQFRLRQIAHDFALRLDERVAERTRIARELHDTLLQSFQGSVLRVQGARDLLPGEPAKALELLDGALDRADQAIVEGRDAIQDLRSSTIVSNELEQAITTLAEEFTNGPEGEKRPPIFSMSVEGTPRDLHPIVRDDIHRIAREALRNAFRHAEADRIEAEVTYGAREVRLRIRDDGKGIDPRHLSAGRARHWGLASMRERAVQIGAQLNLWSDVGAGTEVELRIPGAVAYGTPVSRREMFRLTAASKEAGDER